MWKGLQNTPNNERAHRTEVTTGTVISNSISEMITNLSDTVVKLEEMIKENGTKIKENGTKLDLLIQRGPSLNQDHGKNNYKVVSRSETTLSHIAALWCNKSESAVIIPAPNRIAHHHPIPLRLRLWVCLSARVWSLNILPPHDHPPINWPNWFICRLPPPPLPPSTLHARPTLIRPA